MWRDRQQRSINGKARWGGEEVKDHDGVDVEGRNVATDSTHFTINGNKTFLRGMHDACVFPLTC